MTIKTNLEEIKAKVENGDYKKLDIFTFGNKITLEPVHGWENYTIDGWNSVLLLYEFEGDESLSDREKKVINNYFEVFEDGSIEAYLIMDDVIGDVKVKRIYVEKKPERMFREVGS